MEFYKKFDITDKVRVDTLFKKHFKTVSQLYTTVKPTIKELRKRGIRLAICSAHIDKFFHNEVAKHGLTNMFVEVMGGVEDKRVALPEMESALGFKPEETLYIGDTVHDVVAGRESGAVTVAITWGYSSERKLVEAKPDYVIADIKESLDLL